MGLTILITVLLAMFTLLLQRRAFIGSAALFVLVISNCGEFTFFSMSGMGGVFWAIIFVGLALDAQRERPQPFGGPAFGMMYYGPKAGEVSLMPTRY